MNDSAREMCINITRRCNLHCPYCYVEEYLNKKNNDLKMDLSLEQIKQKVDLSTIDGVFLSGGEPFMHPDIKEIINYFYENGKKVNLATNGLLLNDEMFQFLSHKNISLLISLRDECSETFKIINKLKDYDIEVICYHLPTETSPELLSLMISECPSVKNIKLLYDSKNPKRASEWFKLLYAIYCKLKPNLEDVQITVEIAFLPKKNPIAVDERRGAFDRVIISTEGLYYYCPLLVGNTKGKSELPPVKCQPESCPILAKRLDDENYSSVCCFLVSTLKNAILVGKYGGAI